MRQLRYHHRPCPLPTKQGTLMSHFVTEIHTTMSTITTSVRQCHDLLGTLLQTHKGHGLHTMPCVALTYDLFDWL